MQLEGRVEVGPYGAGSKSARSHQAFLVTADGERMLLRRLHGPPMRDGELETLDGKDVVVDGQRRDRMFLATSVHVAPPAIKAPAPESAPLAPRGKGRQTR